MSVNRQSRRQRKHERNLSRFDPHSVKARTQDTLEAASLQLWTEADREALHEALKSRRAAGRATRGK